MYKALQSQSFMRNPAPILSVLREEGALVQTKIPILGRVWFTTNQSASAEVLKNQERFSVKKKNGQVVGLSWWMPKLLKRLTANMLSSDEPEHTRLRSAVDHAFQRRAISDMAPMIEGLAAKQIAVLFAQGGSVDLVAGFARPFPLAVICELLGLPEQDRTKFSEWASGITAVSGILSFLFAINRLRPLTRYIEARIVHEKNHGGVGLIHELIHNTDADLSDDEIMAMIFLLLLAGHETTTHLIAGGAYALFENPDQLDLLRKNPELIDLAVEEILRFVSPVQMTKPRFVRQDCDVQGVALRAGDLVMPLLIAANFDPAVFDAPEKMDITRKPNRHMEFGTGIHFCLGHQLARLEMKAALNVLFLGERPISPDIALDRVRWNARLGLRSLKELHVRQ